MNQKVIYNCYIDESGDEGTGKKSSPWFVLSAIIVRKDQERLVMDYEKEAVKRIWTDSNQIAPKGIHWRKIAHSKRMVVARIIAQKPYTQIVVAVCKSKLSPPNSDGLGNQSVFYNYACRLLLERLSWFVGDNNGWANIIVSKLGCLDKKELQEYITMIMSRTSCQIRRVFDPSKIEVRGMNELVMLRFADNCTSAFGNALNPDELGEINYYYAELISHHLYRYKERSHALWKYGIKVFPTSINDRDFLSICPHAKKWFGKE